MRQLHTKKFFLTFALALTLLLALTVPACMADGEVLIRLSDSEILVNGKAASENSTDAVYLAHDIIYYEDRDAYDSGNPYGEGTASERHSAQEAAAHTVVHITKPGVYRISGTLSNGQIFVDLGSGAKSDPDAVVTLLLDNAGITCTVAPAVFFYRVYECDQAWVAYDDGDTENYTASAVQDTAKAGANVILADGSVNNVSGSHVARIYKDNGDQKKLHKYDAAFYSRMSMNITGETAGTGVLNVTGDNEGLDTELHLTINGGKINIHSQDDGINTNEDNVSVTTVNGGALHIVAGLGSEGDGIDSNGYLVINGGVVIAIARPHSDSGLDSDCGSYVNGGYVVATGSTMDWAESDSKQVTMNLQFASAQNADEAIIVANQAGKVIFAYDPDKDETTGQENRGYQGAVISCPEFRVGETYSVYVGGDVQGTETDGLYDISTVTGFTGAVRQQYTGTDVGRGPGGMHGMMPPDGERPERPDGQRPEGDGMMERPGDWMDMRPDGEPPFDRPEMPGMSVENEGPASVAFYMADSVNAFSGVTDETAESSNNSNPAGSTNKFSDVPDSAYYSEAVRWAVGRNIASGTGSNTFSPNAGCTYAQILTFLWRAAGEPSAKSNPALAVRESDYYYQAALWACEQGMISASDFTPGSPCTRSTAVWFLWKAAGSPEPAADARFADVPANADYARAVSWAAENGVASGTSASAFSPDAVCSRGQIVTFLHRAFAE